MIFTNKKFDAPTIRIRNEIINFTDETKFFGVSVDSKLKFTNHIRNMCNKVSKLSGIFNKVTSFLNPEVMKIIYSSLVYPNLAYAVEVWGNSNATQIKNLTSIQNKLIGKINVINQLNGNFRKYKLMKFNDIYEFFCPIQFFKSYKIDNIFATLAAQNSVCHSYRTRFSTSENLNIRNIHSSPIF